MKEISEDSGNSPSCQNEITNLLQKQSLPKAGRLCRQIDIAHLFANGKSVAAHPIKIIYSFRENAPQDTYYPVKAMFVVSKRLFPLAVKRNYIRRVMRECYRKHSIHLKKITLQKNKLLHIAIIYNTSGLTNFNGLQEKIIVALNRLQAYVEDIK